MVRKRYWPFEIPSADQLTAEDRRDFGFLESAFRAGHRSYSVEGTMLGASSNNGREGELIRRTVKGRYWEIILSQDGTLTASAFVDGFEPASAAVLSWLRGDDCAAAIELIKHAVVKKPGEHG